MIVNIGLMMVCLGLVMHYYPLIDAVNAHLDMVGVGP